MRRVVVTGMGIVSSIGNNTQEVVASLRDARSGIVKADVYEQMNFRSQVHGSLKIDLEAVVDRRARRFQGDGAGYCWVAMNQAITDSGLEEKDISNPRTGLIVGSGGPSTKAIVAAADTARASSPKRIGPFAVPKAMSSTCSANLSTWFKTKGVNYSISSACSTSVAGSVQFPVPTRIYDDLDLGACPIYEPEVQSVSIGPAGEAPLLLYSNPDRLFEELNERLGLDAVLGMGEIAAWAEAPARAIGRFDVRTPPKSLDEMFACATSEAEREAIRTALFGSVMDVVDRHLPDRTAHAQVRGMLAFLAVNSTYRGPFDPGSALCLAFAMASPGDVTMSKVKGGIGAISDHLLIQFEGAGGELRRHVKVAGITVESGRATGVVLGDGERVTAPVVVSNLDPSATFDHLVGRDGLPDLPRGTRSRKFPPLKSACAGRAIPLRPRRPCPCYPGLADGQGCRRRCALHP